MNLTKLACTTTLLLVAIVCTCCLGNSFTIRNLRLVILDGNLVIILNTPFEGTQVELTHTVEDGLLQLLRVLNTPCRILLMHTVQYLTKLGIVSLIYSLNGTAIFPVWVLHKVKLHL